MGKRSRDKGKRGEREAAAKLADVLGCEARRSQQYCGEAGDADLLTSIDGIHWEVKRVERFSLYPALQQASDDASDDDIPVVLHRRNNSIWVAVVALVDLPDLARRVLKGEQF